MNVRAQVQYYIPRHSNVWRRIRYWLVWSCLKGKHVYSISLHPNVQPVGEKSTSSCSSRSKAWVPSIAATSMTWTWCVSIMQLYCSQKRTRKAPFRTLKMPVNNTCILSSFYFQLFQLFCKMACLPTIIFRTAYTCQSHQSHKSAFFRSLYRYQAGTCSTTHGTGPPVLAHFFNVMCIFAWGG